VIRKVRISDAPIGVAVDVALGHVFVACAGGTVRMLDARSGGIVRTTQVGGGPTSIALDERTGRVFVTHTGYESRGVGVLSAGSGLLLGRKAGYGSLLAVDEPAGRVFIVDEQSGATWILDAATGRPLSTEGPPMIFPQDIAVNQRTGRVFFESEGAIGEVDGMAPLGPKMVLGSIDVSYRDGAMLLDERTNRLYVVSQDYLDQTRWEMGVIDAGAPPGEAAYRVRISYGHPLVWPLGVDEGTGRAYLMPEGLGATATTVVSIFDGYTWRVLRTVTFGAGPIGMVVDQTTRRVFVANNAGTTLSVFDAS
jgi:DNA-binding beta-propeller fold protein YncE